MRLFNFILPLAVFVVYSPMLVAQNGSGKPPQPANAAIEEIKKTIADRNLKQLPNVIPIEILSHVGFTIPKCVPDTMVAKIKGCSQYSCWDKLEIMGLELASQNIVHGRNASRSCVFSVLSKRYFVPPDNLGLSVV